MKKYHLYRVTISGGEPTIHPDFFQILRLFVENGISIHLLSNAERLGDADFFGKILEIVKGSRFSVTTTLHSFDSVIHESMNGKKGSFRRTKQGLKWLIQNGCPVVVKHCITKENYDKLPSFVSSFLEEFPQGAVCQLSGIDYVGYIQNGIDKEGVSFGEIRPYLERAIDVVIEHEQGNLIDVRQKLDLIAIPFCALDPYYWNFITLDSQMKIQGYLAPNMEVEEQNFTKSFKDTGAYGEECRDCILNKLCPGTYQSAFQYVGKELVQRIGIKEKNVR